MDISAGSENSRRSPLVQAWEAEIMAPSSDSECRGGPRYVELWGRGVFLFDWSFCGQNVKGGGAHCLYLFSVSVLPVGPCAEPLQKVVAKWGAYSSSFPSRVPTRKYWGDQGDGGDLEKRLRKNYLWTPGDEINRDDMERVRELEDRTFYKCIWNKMLYGALLG